MKSPTTGVGGFVSRNLISAPEEIRLGNRVILAPFASNNPDTFFQEV